MIFILNTSEQVVSTLARHGTTNKVTPYFEDKHVTDLSTGAETFTFSTFANTKESSNIVGGNFVAFQVDNGFKLFQISEVTEEHDKEHIKTAYCEMAGIELINEILRATTLSSASIEQALTFALQDTEFQVGTIDGSLVDVHTIELKDPIKAYNFIQEYIIGLYGAEISYRVEIKGGRIVGKYIDCYAERGDFTGIRFDYGKNISKVKKVADFTELATALVCQGKNGTTIGSVEAPDKPKGQDWIGDEEAYQLYNRNGSHIFDIFKFDTESPAELLLEARKELAKRCKPKLKYEVAVELLGQEVSIGDTVYIVDNEFNPPLHLSARVSQLQICRTDRTKNTVVLANYKEVVSRITQEDRDLASLIDSRFPIGSSDIKDGAVTSTKIPSNTIQSTHIKEDTITTDHLQAKSITSDKIEAGQIKAEHILANQIKTEHLKAESIDASKIKADAIESEHIKAGAIESEHIQADQIKANHIATGSIETDHIKAGQVVSSHILADQINTNHIQANAITSDKIKAGAITTDKLEAGSITSDKILAGEINADHLATNSITTDKIEAGAISTDKLSANSVSADKLQANSVLTKHIKADQIEATHIKTGAITSDKILANAITSDKIGANQIQASHIKAGSIDATKVTTGELITTSAQIKKGIIGTAHIGNGVITNAQIGAGAIGSANILDGAITSAKISSASISNAHIKDATIESAKIKSISASKIDAGTINTGKINLEGTNGKLRIRDNRLQVFDNSSTPIERVSLGDVNGDGTSYGLRVRGKDGTTILYDENGVYSEGITDGAITNQKIGDNAVDSRKLNLEELFVSEGAFINKLDTVAIKTSRLEVDEIRNDLINLSGLITFDSLDPELNDLLFIEDADKTYINGNTILTNTIKASQIDLYNGLTVKKDGLETFTVATDGSVKMSGTIESFGFSNEKGKEKGYRLTPEGDAYLNDAIVRGSVILPSAGVTNYGNNARPNLMANSGMFTSTKGWVNNGGENGVTPFIASDGSLQGKTSIKYSEVLLEADKTYLIAFSMKTNATSFNANDGNGGHFQVVVDGQTDPHFGKQTCVLVSKEEFKPNTYQTYVYKIKVKPDVTNPRLRFMVYHGDKSLVGKDINIKWAKVEEVEANETTITDWIPNVADGTSTVRFWAGASYEERDNAPFRVLENGKIIATEGEFGGTFTGELSIGNILIKDTNTTSAEFSIKTNDNAKEVIRFTDNSAKIDVDLTVGTILKANVQTRELDLGDGVHLDLAKGQYNLSIGKNDSTTYSVYDIATASGGNHKLMSKNGYGGLSFVASGTQVTAGSETPYDYKFARASSSEAVNVVIKGNLVVDNKITMADNNKIELVSVSGSNSGIDFMIR